MTDASTCTALPPLTEEEFYSLPQSAQIVRLCQEVLTALDAEWLRAKGGRYFRSGRALDYLSDYTGSQADPQKTLRRFASADEPCQACALGGLLLVKIRAFNRCKAAAVDLTQCPSAQRRLLVRNLADIVPPMLLARIECAFECRWPRSIQLCTFSEQKSSPWAECVEAADMFFRIYNANDRLRAIMRYVLHFQGEFPVPSENETAEGVAERISADYAA